LLITLAITAYPFLGKDVEDLDKVHVAVADKLKIRDRSTRIHKDVKFDGGFCRAKQNKKVYTKIDGGSIQVENGCDHQR